MAVVVKYCGATEGDGDNTGSSWTNRMALLIDYGGGLELNRYFTANTGGDPSAGSHNYTNDSCVALFDVATGSCPTLAVAWTFTGSAPTVLRGLSVCGVFASDASTGFYPSSLFGNPRTRNGGGVLNSASLMHIPVSSSIAMLSGSPVGLSLFNARITGSRNAAILQPGADFTAENVSVTNAGAGASSVAFLLAAGARLNNVDCCMTADFGAGISIAAANVSVTNALVYGPSATSGANANTGIYFDAARQSVIANSVVARTKGPGINAVYSTNQQAEIAHCTVVETGAANILLTLSGASATTTRMQILNNYLARGTYAVQRSGGTGIMVSIVAKNRVWGQATGNFTGLDDTPTTLNNTDSGSYSELGNFVAAADPSTWDFRILRGPAVVGGSARAGAALGGGTTGNGWREWRVSR